MTAAQNSSKISQLQQRIASLEADLNALEKYKLGSEEFVSHERSRLIQAESRLSDTGYELDKAQKEKAFLEAHIKRMQTDIQSLEAQYNKVTGEKLAH